MPLNDLERVEHAPRFGLEALGFFQTLAPPHQTVRFATQQITLGGPPLIGEIGVPIREPRERMAFNLLRTGGSRLAAFCR